ncbi:XRE family transcriptional regulator [Pseudoxanthomonas sp. LjRoot125]|uniref:XRE family transcriptional regulator n=1 Tax=Pseudoxanthomonas sp. LjRoot125 TaxID=3342258 RepID=UPI003E11D183
MDKERDKNRGAARVNRYEQQVNLADIEKAAELAAALNVPLAYLFADSDELAELILSYSALDAKQKAKILADVRQKSGADKSGA